MPAATKSITLQGDKPSLRVISGSPWDVCVRQFLRKQSDFTILNVASGQKTVVFSNFYDFHVPLLHHGETLWRFKLFAQPMDRSEVLHTPNHDISAKWKNIPGENELVPS